MCFFGVITVHGRTYVLGQGSAICYSVNASCHAFLKIVVYNGISEGAKGEVAVAFMIAQRAFIKTYLITMVEQHRGYGYQMLEEMRQEFKSFGYSPPQSEIYRALHELVQEGVFYRTKQLKGNDPRVDFQEIVLYHFTEDGHEKAKLYKKQVKADLDRCLGMLNKAVKDNY